MKLRTLSLLGGMVLAGCAVVAPSAGGSTHRFTLVLLKSGARTDLSADQQREVFQGHMANIQRLFDEGPLLVAGPYGREKSDPKLRGVFVFDTADVATARHWAETDPGFQAGVFAFEFLPLTTTADLRSQRVVDLQAQAAAKAAGKPQAPGDTIRPYTMVVASYGAAAQQVMGGQPGVVFTAALDGGRALVVLDAADATAARERLQPHAAALGTFTVDEWYASKLLVDLPFRRAE
ncbi:MAG: hypothetical protein JNK15_15895 [Planctomycetes bacterium]|nr:hypothetical protein [Planctomycetota bacterium]